MFSRFKEFLFRRRRKKVKPFIKVNGYVISGHSAIVWFKVSKNSFRTKFGKRFEKACVRNNVIHDLIPGSDFYYFQR